MLRTLCCYAVFLTAVVAFVVDDQAAEPVRLIFDTDLGGDIDDAMALAVIHALQNRGECELLAVTATINNRSAALMIAVLNQFYGRPNIPIAVVKDGGATGDGYNRPVLELT
jgi:hypothetical protein